MVYPTIRSGGSLPKVEPGQPVTEDYLVAKFSGNTSQSIAVVYDGKSCLHVQDPLLDALSSQDDGRLMNATRFSDLSLIQARPGDQAAASPLAAILGSPPAGTWCQLYEEADLARQQRQWYNILKIWDLARDKTGQSKFDGEFVPFVEAFARSGEWDKAANLTPNSKKSIPIYCSLWQQLDQTQPDSASKSGAVQAVMTALKCKEYGIKPMVR
jgi:hypothetical protein